MHFIYFLGRFHVLAVHLPITLVLVVAGLAWLTRGGRRPDLQGALSLAWAATAITAIGTVILGYMHFSEGGFQGFTVDAHRALGTSIAVVATIGWILRSRSKLVYQKVGAPIVVLLVALVVVTGHFGGDLTHGSGYLTEYAPNFIREMAGLPPTEAAGPRVTTLAAADPYTDVIGPVLKQRCSECHNKSKRKGGLNMSTYATLMKGGGDGPVIVKGDAQDSELIRRISLPVTAHDFMPHGKPALSADQIAVFRWWVDSGAKTGVKVASLKPPADIQDIIQRELNPASPGGAEVAVAQKPNAATNSKEAESKEAEAVGTKIAKEEAQSEAQPRKPADPKMIASLVNVGFMARQVSLGDPRLVVSPAAPGQTVFSAGNLQTLATVGNDQVVDLNLANSGLSGSEVAPLAHLTALKHLRLDANKLNDQSVQALSALPKLVEVNLYGNRGITDASIPVLAGMKSLRKVYLWQTGVTRAGIKKLHKLRPDMEIDAGDMSVAPTAVAQNPDPSHVRSARSP